MRTISRLLFIIIFLVWSITGCSINPFSANQYSQNIAKVEVNFKVSLPTNSEVSTGLFLEVLDELTGLGLNPSRYPMQTMDGLTYSLKMSFPRGFLIKYRYVKEGNPSSIEFDAQKNQVRYRLVYINSPLTINDQISGWQNDAFDGNTGILQGYVFNSETSEPISNVMIVIAGMRAFTGSDGSYVIPNVPVGEQFITAVHVDGLFQPFQQKAVIATNATTPANFGMSPSRMVNITFSVTPPAENLNGAPIRLFGDFLSLGNTFNEKQGGTSTDVSSGKVLSYREDGSCALTLTLPASYPLEYKYSLGDGFWNAERDSNKNFRIRRIIVPSEDTTIHDVITTWQNTNEMPLTFHLSVPPSTTPSEAVVLIQLNPFVWMEPLPVWNLGNNQWLYVVYSPMEFVRSSTFRVLLNDSGTILHDQATSNSPAEGIKIDPLASDINYSVIQWSIPK